VRPSGLGAAPTPAEEVRAGFRSLRCLRFAQGHELVGQLSPRALPVEANEPVERDRARARCAIDSDGNGYNIYATNNGPGPVTCTGSCSVSTSDGFTQTVNCTTTIQAGYSDVPICGTGPGSPGRPPYSNAQLSADSTCNR
jgi:hypothetical protein